MEVDRVTKERQYHGETSQKIVRSELIHESVTVPDPKPSHQAKETAAALTDLADQSYQRKMEALRKFFGRQFDWRELHFKQHEINGKTYVIVYEMATGEVVKVVPSPAFDRIISDVKDVLGSKINMNV